MRELGKLPDSSSARAFAGYLQSLSIETKLEESSNGCAIWVIDEDRIRQARQQFEQYLKDPADERYRKGIPLKPDPERFATAPKAVPNRPRSRSEGFFASPSECRLTLALLVTSVFITLLYGNADQQRFVQKQFYITYYVIHPKLLPEVQEGQVWRLVTPIFIHFDAMHLVFNMFWLYVLGGQIERLIGPQRLGLMVLSLAIFSNLGQYFFSHVGLENWRLVLPERNPDFGGMSGVVYGLFGFIWMKMVYQPGCGLFLRPLDIFIMMLWFFLCFTGAVGAIANTAHMVGLVLGMICGYVGAWLNGWGHRDQSV